jgi:hypothetical protein
MQDAGSCLRTGERKMRYTLILLSLLLAPVLPANAQVSIGINMPVYPDFQRVPGYPVYYAPQVGLNLFFYDGMYWAYQNDNCLFTSGNTRVIDIRGTSSSR